MTPARGITIGVAGLWHLGSVTAACLAHKGFSVVGYDPDPAVIENLKQARPPVFEPGLEALIREQIKEGRLEFTNSAETAVSKAGLIWITFDTPVDDQDNADVSALMRDLAPILAPVRIGQSILVSSQAPVGFCRGLEETLQQRHLERVPVGCSPENLRLGKAIDVFENPDRIVMGIRRPEDRGVFEPILSQLSKEILWMKTESAEMTKHAINSFLATSVTLANELAVLCEEVGADAREVERGLKSESRIGPRAYLKPGAAFAGGTLARDVQFLTQIGRRRGKSSFLLNAVLQSNDDHKQWAYRRLETLLTPLRGKRVAILGLTYKAGTDTLRRSSAVELAQQLHAQGVTVQAFDWQLDRLPADLASIIDFKKDCASALEGCSGLVIGTDHPGVRSLQASDLRRMVRPLVVDPNGSLDQALLNSAGALEYYSVGLRRRRDALTHETQRSS